MFVAASAAAAVGAAVAISNDAAAAALAAIAAAAVVSGSWRLAVDGWWLAAVCCKLSQMLEGTMAETICNEHMAHSWIGILIN